LFENIRLKIKGVAAARYFARPTSFHPRLHLTLTPPFEKLHGTLVAFGRREGAKCPEIAPLARAGIALAGIETILTGF